MTAIAVAYVSAGFAVSAEGRQQWAHQPTRDRGVRADEREDIQKIFEVTGTQAVLAYTVSGDIASRDRNSRNNPSLFRSSAPAGSHCVLVEGREGFNATAQVRDCLF